MGKNSFFYSLNYVIYPLTAYSNIGLKVLHMGENTFPMKLYQRLEILHY